jgi:hypothetical protein
LRLVESHPVQAWLQLVAEDGAAFGRRSGLSVDTAVHTEHGESSVIFSLTNQPTNELTAFSRVLLEHLTVC